MKNVTLEFPWTPRVSWSWADEDGALAAVGDLYALAHLLDDRVIGDRWQIAVQAGTASGLWPAYLATRFQVVHTFEPAQCWQQVLRRNIDAGNARCYPFALGESSGAGAMHQSAGREHNRGADFVIAGSEFPVVALDSLNLGPRVDLIQLDIEGMEAAALRGAHRTIERDRPFVVVEVKSMAHNPDNDPCGVLEAMGYRRLAAIRNDQLWAPR